MKLRGLSFDDGQVPDFVSVSMTGDEALFLAAFIGQTNARDCDSVMADGGRLGSDIYDCLVGGVFNRYYEDGVTDALRKRSAPGSLPAEGEQTPS